MKLGFLFTLMVLIVGSAQAQWLPDGSIINNFQMTDINNQTIDAYQTTALGKHIVIDFSATWCSGCLSYHNSNVLEDYYNAYGPNGTIAQDAQVVFYESDFTTTNNDLLGFGTNTIADWTLGVSYPICNEIQPEIVINNFLVTPANIAYPSVIVLCENNSYYRLSTSITDPTQLRNLIITNCSSTPLNLTSLDYSTLNFSISPNPATDQFSIKYELKKAAEVTINIIDITGKSVYYSPTNTLSSGKHKHIMDKLNISSGIYFVKLGIDGTFITKKITINK